MSKMRWRCFHCGEVFLSVVRAKAHFGDSMDSEAACKLIGHEIHLIDRIRKLEGELDVYRSGSDEILLAIMALEDAHRRAVIRAEEEGYAKGSRDGLALAKEQ